MAKVVIQNDSIVKVVKVGTLGAAANAGKLNWNINAAAACFNRFIPLNINYCKNNTDYPTVYNSTKGATRAPFAGTLTKWMISVGAYFGGAGDQTFQIYKNGVATGTTIMLLNNTAEISADISVSFDEGDFLSLYFETDGNLNDYQSVVLVEPS